MSKKKDPKKEVTTAKKQKFLRARSFVDAETGEVVPFQEVSVEERDFNFHKVWLQHLVNSLDGISNQKLRLAFWIIDNLNKENQLVMTQRTISEKSGISLNTVSKTMKALQEGEPAFLIKINSGAYQVNPNVVWKGSYNSRMGILYNYNTKKKATQNESEKETEKELEGQTSMFAEVESEE